MKILLLLLAIILFFPLYWMCKNSLETSMGIKKIPPNWIPKKITLENFRFIAMENPLIRWFANTVAMHTIVILMGLFCTVTASYAFAVFKFRGSKILYWVFLTGIMVPYQALLISRFILMRHLGLLNTWWAIICLGVFSPIGIVLIKNYFQKIPQCMYDSARIDGAGDIRILFQIILPQCTPILGYMCIVSYVSAFQDFFWPMLVLNNSKLYTLPLGIVHYYITYMSTHPALEYERLWGIQMAGGVIMFLPVILIFVIFRKVFMKQFSLGGIKG